MLTCAKNIGALQIEGFQQTILHMKRQQLTAEQVHEIRTSGLTDAAMARKLGCSYVAVNSARRGISWKDHPTPPDTGLRKGGGRNCGDRAVASNKNCGIPSLTFDAVHHIRTSGLPDEELARIHNVSRSRVTSARRGRSWPDHPTPPDLFPRIAGQKSYAGRDRLEHAPKIDLHFEPYDRVLFDRLRMWCRVDGSGCWIWTQSCSGSIPRPSGHHGTTSIKGRSISTHRAMWIALYGEIPDGLHVCHTCDKPPCIHPFHLWLGTHADNMRDSIIKGRHVNVRDEEPCR